MLMLMLQWAVTSTPVVVVNYPIQVRDTSGCRLQLTDTSSARIAFRDTSSQRLEVDL